MYGHLFRDGTGHYLFVEPLGFGVSCQCQLVLHCETGELRVRKVLHRRLPSGSGLLKRAAPGERRVADTAGDFTNDAGIALLLARHALEAGITLRVPALLSDAAIPDERAGKVSRVSYWSLCNGGSVSSFAYKCRAAGATIPRGLILRLLQHLLETLHFMYSALPEPLVHGDLHAGNVLLHWPAAGASVVPDFFLADFGTATWLRCLGRPGSKNNNDNNNNNPGCADLAGLCDMLDKELLPVAAPAAADDAADAAADPVRVAYDMLARLQRDASAGAPDLTAVLAHVREHAMRALPDLILSATAAAAAAADACDINNNIINDDNTAPSCCWRVARQMMADKGQAPRLYPTVGAVLDARNVPGPWHVAEVDAATLAVRQVVVVAVAAGAGGPDMVKEAATTHHRPNEDNADSETEAAWCECETDPDPMSGEEEERYPGGMEEDYGWD